MKKIGILTYHNSDNFGSILQCYALKTFIEGICDYKVEVINYSYIELLNYFETDELKGKFFEKLKNFEEFRNKYLNLSGKMFSDIRGLNDLLYDYYIVGSDTVWQTSQNKNDAAYFLNFAPKESVKIAYAASTAGNKNINKELFEKYIPRFDYLSVREESTRSFVQEYTKKKVEVTLDPTFLLKTVDYELLIEDEMKDEQDYLVLYLLYGGHSTPYAINFANMISRKYNLKVKHFLPTLPDYIFKNENESFAFETPGRFLNIFKNAKMVITNSFHGTVFSLIYNTPFYSFINKKGGERIIDLLKICQLEDRAVTKYIKLDEINFSIDWKKVNELLDNERQASKEFIVRALENGRDE